MIEAIKIKLWTNTVNKKCELCLEVNGWQKQRSMNNTSFIDLHRHYVCEEQNDLIVLC